jgi:hypothetical protein
MVEDRAGGLTRRQPTAPTPAISGNSTAITPRETGRTELVGDDFPTFRWRHDARVKLTGAPHPIYQEALTRRCFHHK